MAAFKPEPGQIITGALFSEPMRLEVVSASGCDGWTLGLVGTQTERCRSVTLTGGDLSGLTVHAAAPTFEGDGNLLRLGLQASSLGIAYEFDPYFGLSISRVDPLPHQLEAVYDYLLRLARVRFLLADDAGAGRTVGDADLRAGQDLTVAVDLYARFGPQQAPAVRSELEQIVSDLGLSAELRIKEE